MCLVMAVVQATRQLADLARELEESEMEYSDFESFATKCRVSNAPGAYFCPFLVIILFKIMRVVVVCRK